MVSECEQEAIWPLPLSSTLAFGTLCLHGMVEVLILASNICVKSESKTGCESIKC
jgi:hypothetical protein